jgi:hypothetical protein
MGMKNYKKIKNKKNPKTHQEKKYKKCKLKSKPKLKTWRCKMKTYYMLEDDSNMTLFY